MSVDRVSFLTDSKNWELSLETCRADTGDYLDRMYSESGVFRLTEVSDPSDYARCFYVFLAHTLKRPQRFPADRLANDIRAALWIRRKECAENYRGKPFRQLLAFSLSALSILGDLSKDPLSELVEEQIPDSVSKELESLGCLEGCAGAGNHAMFLAIFLIHSRDYLGYDTSQKLEEWINLHISYMNRFGFWGSDKGMSHLQFQNGYHQHEILEYLGTLNPRLEETLSAVQVLADPQGHFAPYPGGGGCYDYDAVFMLTPEGRIPDAVTRSLLRRTAATIMSEQRPDGGFSESIRVRPRSLENLRMFAYHTLEAIGKGPLFNERLRYALTLQRPKHNRIHTHWSCYSRRWDESDLWDSWFRMLALARIDVALHPEHSKNWGFIDYPGIGFHPSLRS